MQLIALFEKIETIISTKSHEMFDQAKQWEVVMEERILRSVNDQVDVAMTKVNATIIRDLVEKMEHIELRVGQPMEGNSVFSPLTLDHQKGLECQSMTELIRSSARIQGPKKDFSLSSGDDPDEWLARYEYIFEMYETSKDQKVIQAVTSFIVEARS
jgi:hypothetical protein